MEEWKRTIEAHLAESKSRYTEDIADLQEQLAAETKAKAALERAREQTLSEMAEMRRELSSRATTQQLQGMENISINISRTKFMSLEWD